MIKNARRGPNVLYPRIINEAYIGIYFLPDKEKVHFHIFTKEEGSCFLSFAVQSKKSPSYILKYAHNATKK